MNYMYGQRDAGIFGVRPLADLGYYACIVLTMSFSTPTSQVASRVPKPNMSACPLER
jgi:hypothetical protein